MKQRKEYLKRSQNWQREIAMLKVLDSPTIDIVMDNFEQPWIVWKFRHNSYRGVPKVKRLQANFVT